jgi:hypothetical protein
MDVDVLAFHDKSMLCWMFAPEPLAISDVEVELLVKKAMFAEAVPVAVGAKVTVKGMLWPLAIVAGKVIPPSVNSELFELAEDKLTLPPLAVRLPLKDWLAPIWTLPKLMDPGVTLRVPLELVAEPERDTDTEGSEAVELREAVEL